MQYAGCPAEVELEPDGESTESYFAIAGDKKGAPAPSQGQATVRGQPQQQVPANPFKDPAILKMTDAELVAYLKEDKRDGKVIDPKRLKVISEICIRGIPFDFGSLS
jgi:hypothetical protein